MFTKMFGPPLLANDYSYADRTTLRRSCGDRRACLEGRDYSRPRSPRDAMHAHFGSSLCMVGASDAR